MLVFTHRGLQPSTSNFFPESSLEAFRDQLSRGFGLEFDPNFVKDGIVVSHDATLKRITDGRDARDFHNVTVKEITALRYRTKNGDGTPTQEGRIPTFDELLELINKSKSKINALHLKGKFQDSVYLERLVSALSRYPHLINKLVIFDAKPETARYLHNHLTPLVNNDQTKIHIAPSVAHQYDIKRYNNAVLGTLISVEDALKYRQEGLYDWVWLDEWDLADENNGKKTLYNKAVFETLKHAGFKIALVTPELHGTSPGLLGGEAHEDAASKERLFERIQEIIDLKPDAICTDYPNEAIQQ
ncbi:MAG: hypothetical protein KGJ07_03605 [Patescibacteria group bacterium]|nr:hypothetical protein [Patescibacteria group bacterium]